MVDRIFADFVPGAPFFFGGGGSSDENFLPTAGYSFAVDALNALKTVKKPLNFRNFSKNCGRLGQRGGQKHTWTPLALTGYAL